MLSHERRTALFGEHLAERRATTERALQETGFDRLLLHSGRPFTYFADDNDAPFHPTPHFAHWAPVEGPGHLLEITPGSGAPRLHRVTPRDYWYEPPSPPADFVREAFDVVDVGSPELAWGRVSLEGKTAYVGGAPDEAIARGLPAAAVNPPALVARLDWERSYKSAYEAETMADATERAARGHAAARTAFESGASEIEIHHAYVSAVGDVDEHLPYTSIVGLDEHAATLHYHGKLGKDGRPGNVLLIDAGASARAYGCDITRTYAKEGAHPVFRALVDGMDRLQRELAAAARPGVSYVELHLDAHRKIGALLSAVGVLKVSGDDAFARGLTLPFFPHGLGHHLGIQVHDVAGRQVDRTGTIAPPPAEHPALRTTRVVEERHLFTIEPGLYFIPMLLDPYREGARNEVDWALVDALLPCGGIRIEDNVYVGKAANRNFTRDAGLN
jgi:Xaa-Pro dipeptidase